MHRQGYRFIEKVVSSQHSVVSREEEKQKAKIGTRNWELGSSTPPFPSLNPNSQSPNPTLVGRDAELTRLHNLLAKALNGERQMVFVAGEAGIGKTALIDAFLSDVRGPKSREANQKAKIENQKSKIPYSPTPNPWSLDWSGGSALSTTGRGRPICRCWKHWGGWAECSGGERLVPVLSQVAPTWLAQLPALLSPAELEAVQRRVQGATRERMLREIAEAIEALSVERPLVLVLEDLHWSDPSTVELLALLARRREAARLLVVGTYRPVELVVTNHPLKAMKQELVARGQETEVLLGGLSREAVHAYVTQRVAQSTDQDEIVTFVHQRTEGHPLFMVQVTDYLLQQDLNQVLPQEAIQAVPGGLQQLIEVQLGRLGEEAQQVLEVASVAGAEFAVASVAAGLQTTTDAIDTLCEELGRRGQFIEERGWQRGRMGR